VDNAAENTVPPRVHRTYWWKEALIMLAFYGLYSWSRNQFGSANIGIGDKPWQAFHNAERIIRFERAIGLYHEESVQDWFLRFRGFIRFWNTYYGTAHFLVTLAVFWILFLKRKHVFPQWRNTLALDPLRNSVFWIGIATKGKSWAIPMGHPNGEVLVPEERGDGSTVPPPGYRKFTDKWQRVNG